MLQSPQKEGTKMRQFRNIDFHSVRQAELCSADGRKQQAKLPLQPNSGVKLRWAHRLQAYVPATAIFKNVARIRKLATNVPRNVPETLDSPPLRHR
jgi:hypothetical protein